MSQSIFRPARAGSLASLFPLALGAVALLSPAATAQATGDLVEEVAMFALGETLDDFGERVAICGDTVVVGAPMEDSDAVGVNGDPNNNNALRSGAAFVFVRGETGWIQEAYLKASNADINDAFGASVAISGDTIIVGANLEDGPSSGVNGDQSNGLPMSTNTGAAYVFVRSGTTWTQEAYLKASNPDNTDLFGSSVAVSGDVAVVGAWAEDGPSTGLNGPQGNSNPSGSSGAAYIFRRSGTTWSQEAYVKAPTSSFGLQFAEVLAASGDTVVAGSRVGGGAGAAYVFVHDGATWSQQAVLQGSSTESGDSFADALAISGDTLVVGAPGEDSASSGVNGDESDNSLTNSGAAYVFERTGTSWTQEAYLKASNPEFPDLFGQAVAVSGNTVVVGAPWEDSNAVGIDGDASDNSAKNSGAVYAFLRTGATWAQQAYVKASDTGVLDRFGHAVAASGTTVVTGTDEELIYLHELPSLATNDASISLAAGGQQGLALNAGTSRASWFYRVLGSVTGTSPGIDFGGGIVLPLNVDAYFNLTVNKPFLGPFGSYIGLFDELGIAEASLMLPSGVDPDLAGITLFHAYLAAPIFGEIEFASNASSVLLVP